MNSNNATSDQTVFFPPHSPFTDLPGCSLNPTAMSETGRVIYFGEFKATLPVGSVHLDALYFRSPHEDEPPSLPSSRIGRALHRGDELRRTQSLPNMDMPNEIFYLEQDNVESKGNDESTDSTEEDGEMPAPVVYHMCTDCPECGLASISYKVPDLSQLCNNETAAMAQTAVEPTLAMPSLPQSPHLKSTFGLQDHEQEFLAPLSTKQGVEDDEVAVESVSAGICTFQPRPERFRQPSQQDQQRPQVQMAGAMIGGQLRPHLANVGDAAYASSPQMCHFNQMVVTLYPIETELLPELEWVETPSDWEGLPGTVDDIEKSVSGKSKDEKKDSGSESLETRKRRHDPSNSVPLRQDKALTNIKNATKRAVSPLEAEKKQAKPPVKKVSKPAGIAPETQVLRWARLVEDDHEEEEERQRSAEQSPKGSAEEAGKDGKQFGSFQSASVHSPPPSACGDSAIRPSGQVARPGTPPHDTHDPASKLSSLRSVKEDDKLAKRTVSDALNSKLVGKKQTKEAVGTSSGAGAVGKANKKGKKGARKGKSSSLESRLAKIEEKAEDNDDEGEKGALFSLAQVLGQPGAGASPGPSSKVEPKLIALPEPVPVATSKAKAKSKQRTKRNQKPKLRVGVGPVTNSKEESGPGVEGKATGPVPLEEDGAQSTINDRPESPSSNGTEQAQHGDKEHDEQPTAADLEALEFAAARKKRINKRKRDKKKMKTQAAQTGIALQAAELLVEEVRRQSSISSQSSGSSLQLRSPCSQMHSPGGGQNARPRCSKHSGEEFNPGWILDKKTLPESFTQETVSGGHEAGSGPDPGPMPEPVQGESSRSGTISLRFDHTTPFAPIFQDAVDQFKLRWQRYQARPGSKTALRPRDKKLAMLFFRLFDDVDVSQDLDFYHLFERPVAVTRWISITYDFGYRLMEWEPVVALRMSPKPFSEDGNREVRLLPEIVAQAVEAARNVRKVNDWICKDPFAQSPAAFYYYDIPEAITEFMAVHKEQLKIPPEAYHHAWKFRAGIRLTGVLTPDPLEAADTEDLPNWFRLQSVAVVFGSVQRGKLMLKKGGLAIPGIRPLMTSAIVRYVVALDRLPAVEGEEDKMWMGEIDKWVSR